MQITVSRQWYTAKSTCGQLSIDGNPFCFTLEPPRDPTNTIKPRAIPAGSYSAIFVMSSRFHVQVLQLQNVPGFLDIEIHMGNDAPDTEGCTLLGETHSPDWVGTSDDCFKLFMHKVLAEGGPYQVTYVDNLPASVS